MPTAVAPPGLPLAFLQGIDTERVSLQIILNASFDIGACAECRRGGSGRFCTSSYRLANSISSVGARAPRSSPATATAVRVGLLEWKE
ncbi:hypothetical protein F441_03362, partial [Phytophthora nicotianae CJ01A1]